MTEQLCDCCAWLGSSGAPGVWASVLPPPTVPAHCTRSPKGSQVTGTGLVLWDLTMPSMDILAFWLCPHKDTGPHGAVGSDGLGLLCRLTGAHAPWDPMLLPR